MPGSPAARAGLRSEDIILEIDGVPVEDAADLQKRMIDRAIGRAVELQIFRGGEPITVAAVPEELKV